MSLFPRNKRQIFGHRDGFTIDSVMSIQDLTSHNPLFMAAVLAFFVKRAGASFRVSLLGWLLQKQNRTWGITLSGIFLIGAITRQLSDHFSFRARNNGVADKYDWTKEVVVVTGASSGIGARVSQMLTTRGIKVAGIDVQEPTYEVSPRMKFYTCDITDSDQLKDVGRAINKDLGEPTILLNNAGIGPGGAPIVEQDDKVIDRVMQINALSHFKTAREFVPAMLRKDHGHVITIASMASYVSPPGLAPYGMSKAAAMAFHETLTMELITYHKTPRIRTSLINPLWTQTPLVEKGVAVGGGIGPKLMHVDTVAENIVEVILSGESQHRCLPRSVTLGSYIRGAPDWLHWIVMRGAARDHDSFYVNGLEALPAKS